MCPRKTLTRPKNNAASQSAHVFGSRVLGRSLPLQQVPENGVVDLDESSSPSVERRDFCKSEEWSTLQNAVIGVFQKKTSLTPEDMASLHRTVKNIMYSKTGVFAYDYYKQELLTRGMVILTEDFRGATAKTILQLLENTWDYFFAKILPTLEAILYLVNTKGELTVRQATLVAFRDVVLLKVNIQDALRTVDYKVSPSIRHMLLILQAVNDTYPPSKNKLQLENITSRIVVPYLGYRGLYEGGSQPVVMSMEPVLASRRRSGDAAFLRKMSRPFSMQPNQKETLNELFLSAIRKQESSGSH